MMKLIKDSKSANIYHANYILNFNFTPQWERGPRRGGAHIKHFLNFSRKNVGFKVLTAIFNCKTQCCYKIRKKLFISGTYIRYFLQLIDVKKFFTFFADFLVSLPTNINQIQQLGLSMSFLKNTLKVNLGLQALTQIFFHITSYF